MPTAENVEEALHMILTSDAAVVDVVADRIYPDRAPDTYVGAYIVYQLVFGEPDQTHESADSLTRARYQVDCYAERADTARDLAKKVKKALHGFKGGVGSPSPFQVGYMKAGDGPSGFGDTDKLYRRIVEVEVIFEEPAS